MDETLRIAEKMEDAARPLWEGKTEPGGPPAIERFFFVAWAVRLLVLQLRIQTVCLSCRWF